MHKMLNDGIVHTLKYLYPKLLQIDNLIELRKESDYKNVKVC